jgi:hypothetical protein
MEARFSLHGGLRGLTFLYLACFHMIPTVKFQREMQALLLRGEEGYGLGRMLSSIMCGPMVRVRMHHASLGR